MSKHIIIPIFVPHKGCPYDCIYCNQKSISGQKEEMTEERMRSIIESHISTAENDDYMEIGFYGGSFTGIDETLQYEFLSIANEYIHTGKVREIRLSTRPDYINKHILVYLKQYGVKTIELGVQSLDDDVLRQSCRGHNAGDVVESAYLIKDNGLNLGIQTMIGLPGDSREKDLYTARRVIDLAPELVRIYPTLVIKGTELEKMFTEGLYVPLSLDEAADICAELLELYCKSNIDVIRVGLQPTDDINENNEIAAGPFHPAFRQLAESRLALKNMENIIINNKLYESKKIVIYSGNKNVSNIIGQKRGNITYLKEKYKFDYVKVIINDEHDGEIVPINT